MNSFKQLVQEYNLTDLELIADITTFQQFYENQTNALDLIRIYELVHINNQPELFKLVYEIAKFAESWETHNRYGRSFEIARQAINRGSYVNDYNCFDWIMTSLNRHYEVPHKLLSNFTMPSDMYALMHNLSANMEAVDKDFFAKYPYEKFNLK